MENKLSRWTREGILDFSWSSFESFEKLILDPHLREKMIRRVSFFLQGEAEYHHLQLPWRHGIFFFGPSGCGKTAASRAIARSLDWHHLTIPAHEILDSHLFEIALRDAVSVSYRVIVLEDVDRMIQVMEPETFFTLLDHSMQRAEGTFWVANSRRPEDAPKIQLLRPGRFDEAIRLELPQAALRAEILKKVLGSESEEWDEATLQGWMEKTQGLTFSHFEELRQITARMKLEKQNPSELLLAVKTYLEDQLIAGDRWGGISPSSNEIHDRVRHLDPRLLMAALDMTDVFRKLIEKVISDRVEEAKVPKSSVALAS